jgi:hypothetical protein
VLPLWIIYEQGGKTIKKERTSLSAISGDGSVSMLSILVE